LSINAAQTSIALNLNNITFNTHGTGEAMRIVNTTKNVLIGTTTDAGYKLDVNGTARVTGNLSVGTGSILSLNGTGNNNGLISQGNSLLQVYNRSILVTTFFNGGSEAATGIQIGYNLSLGMPPVNLSTALLELTSTTKGFLQPRMTNAQALAITSPATGLQAYDNTNNKNLLYNGTAWQNIATESWVTGQGYLTSQPWTVSGSNIYYNTGNVLIGTTTDAGYKLDVNGTARVQGDALYVYSTGNIEIGRDTTYSTPYMAVGFGGRSNGFNKIFGARDTTDGIYISSATGRGIKLETKILLNPLILPPTPTAI